MKLGGMCTSNYTTTPWLRSLELKARAMVKVMAMARPNPSIQNSKYIHKSKTSFL